MTTETCNGFAARRDYETCGQPVIHDEREGSYEDDNGERVTYPYTITLNADGTPHTCRRVRTGERPGCV